MLKKILIAIGITLISVILLCASVGLWFINKPLLPLSSTPASATRTPTIDFLFAQGSSVKSLANQLYNLKVLPHPSLFVWLAKIKGKTTELQAGEYRITAGITTPTMLLDMMIKGEAIRHSFTIVEGWTFAQIKAAINNNPYLTHELKNLSDAEIMRHIGREGEMPEGRFAPETYVFSGKVSDTAILRNAHNVMKQRLNTAWQARSSQQQQQTQAIYKCPYELLIIASMIEKESAYLKERPLIAGVIIHRLQLKMPLQIDATVIYGLGENYKGKLFENDLKKDSAYNTYTRIGLPPTPIAAPSQNAIHAALNPTMTTALYYVATGDKDGSHFFSNTLDEHIQAKARYLNKIR